MTARTSSSAATVERDDAPVNCEVEDTAPAPDAATESTGRLTDAPAVAAYVAKVAAAAIDVDATAAGENIRQSAHGAVAQDDLIAHAAQLICWR
jgi:hypothetical protein